MSLLKRLVDRFSHRRDAEHVQVAIRIAIVSVAMVYFHSDYFSENASNELFAHLARAAVNSAFAITMGLFLALMIDPRPSVPRRILGMLHDVTAISTAMLLGESSSAAVAAIYLWVTLGNGFRYGPHYLYACAALSIIGFSLVFAVSDYWRANATLSINILVLLALIPPYVGRLLKSLYAAKAALKHRASIDALTSLMNRPEVEHRIEMYLSRQRNGHVLMFCDLDRFKQVNDVAGHAAGDQLLIDVGRIIRGCVREDDLVARLGGDEFCVFLRKCSVTRAREIAEDIRNSVSAYRLGWGTEYYTVGVSIGVAPSDAIRDMSSLFRLADAACYAAKNAGRNQVHVINPEFDIEDSQVIRRLCNAPGKTAGIRGKSTERVSLTDDASNPG